MSFHLPEFVVADAITAVIRDNLATAELTARPLVDWIDDTEDDKTGRIIVDVSSAEPMEASPGNYSVAAAVTVKTLIAPHENISTLKTNHRDATGLVRDYFYAPNILDCLNDLASGVYFHGIHARSCATTATDNFLYSTINLKLEIAVTA